MNIFKVICNQPSYAFVLLISIFTFLFFLAIYLTTERYKSVLMILIANGLKVLSAILHYITAFSKFNLSTALYDLMGSIQITLMVVAILIIFGKKVNVWPLVFFNLINIVQGLYFTLSGVDIALVHSTNSFILALLSIYCIIILAEKKLQDTKVSSVIALITLGMFILFHVSRGTVYLLVALGINGFSRNSEVIPFISILSFSLFQLLNLMIVYLNFSYLIRKVRKLSYTDKLTGALNRSFFIKLLEVKLADIKRLDENLVIAILDIDDFKQVNDTYGHLVGDEVLRKFTEHLRECVRKNDIICRYGGEEFLVLMEVAGKEEAEAALLRLHESVRGLKITEHDISVTFSGGMEYLSEEDADRDIEEIIRVIDERMYKAKNAGKNCIV